MFRGVIFDGDGGLLNARPGATELLDELKRKGVKIAFGYRGDQAPLTENSLSFGEYFDIVTDGAPGGPFNPDSGVFLIAAERLGLQPWDCAVFTDTASGIAAARQAGMYAIGVGNPESVAGADLFINDLRQCPHEELFTDRRWRLQEDEFDVKNNRHYEGAFTTGNGYLSVRGSLEEGLVDDPQDEEYWRTPANVTLEEPRPMKSKWGTFIPGIVGRHPLLNTEIINLPWFLEFVIYLDNERLDLEQCAISHYTRFLNLRDATLIRSFRWKTKTGVEIAVEFTRFISLKTNSLAVQRVRVRGINGCGEIRIESGINAGVKTNGFNHFTSVNAGVTDAGFIAAEVITDGGNRVQEMVALQCPDQFSRRPVHGDKRIYEEGRGMVRPGETLEFIKLTGLATDWDLEGGEVRERAVQTLVRAKAAGFALLYREHSTCWNQKWRYSDVVIEGDDQAQLALRFAVYHLIRSQAEHDPRVAVCAKGYAGEAYFGRYFWDNEIYLLPFFMYTNPEAARNLVLFRYHTLNGARENARCYGYHGARYAWESSRDGAEECACWQYADHEVHITADVIYALWHYFRQFGDRRFMTEFGLEMLVETARYWTERVDYHRKTGSYELLGVMGPDEYLPFTKNNAYTNMMVKFSLEKTLAMLSCLAENDPQAYGRLVEKLRISRQEIDKFGEIAVGLPLPYDPERKLVLQSEDFEDYADLDFQEIWQDRGRPFGHFVSQERNYRAKALKQADVLMLMLLLPGLFSSEEMEKAYCYYEPLTTHDSSLSPSVHAIIAAWLGKMTEAAAYFRKAAALDLDPYLQGCVEGIHIANAGGIWQTVIHGFAGVRNAIQSDALTLQPHLPDTWRSLRFHLLWKGEPVEVTIDQTAVLVANLSDAPLNARIGNESLIIPPGGWVRKKLAAP